MIRGAKDGSQHRFALSVEEQTPTPIPTPTATPIATPTLRQTPTPTPTQIPTPTPTPERSGSLVASVRVRLTDRDYLQLAEVVVVEKSTARNLALTGTATQSSLYNAHTAASKANDGKLASSYPSVSITKVEQGAWWRVDLAEASEVETISVYNRTGAGTRLEAAVVEALDSSGNVLWSDVIKGAKDGSTHNFTVSTQ